MKWRNQTLVKEFILIGFSSMPKGELLLFPLLLVIYLATVAGNLLIIYVILVDAALQSPMYFFLRNLAFIEICFTLDTVPQMLINLLVKEKSISFVGCAIQMCCFFYFGCAECFILAAMSYDRYVAICNPLYYATVINRTFCYKLLGGVWMIGIPVALLQAVWIFNLPFCGHNKVNHFFCDAPPVLKLVCTDTYQYEMQAIASTFVFLMFPCILILISYINIISTILKMPTVGGRRKAFSTCSSHLIVVTLFYGSASLVYLRPKSNYSPEIKKILSLFYTVITPMLNPFVYALRNSEMRESLKRTLRWKVFSPTT
ncbi:olfactory receptor 10A7-like [Paroedura picta]|uniref:olfactory receptor 10A7-like n=1 Tax=Paroedura picta TaxID=143630 RepID=UPI0040579CE4